jgi:hypothetical protein
LDIFWQGFFYFYLKETGAINFGEGNNLLKEHRRRYESVAACPMFIAGDLTDTQKK